jgi:hypothetical protein
MQARCCRGDLKRRRALLTWLAVVALAPVLGACGGDEGDDAPTGAAAAEATAETAGTHTEASAEHGMLSVALGPVEDSGVSGDATLRKVGKKVRVTVRLSEPLPGRLPAHLHVGTCEVVPNLDVLNSLDEIVDGKSHTTLKFTTWADVIEKDELSIHVHSPDLATLACGDVPHGS